MEGKYSCCAFLFIFKVLLYSKNHSAMSTPDYPYYQQLFADVPKPFAYVDLDAFDANLVALAQRAAGKPIRVASKSVRCLPLLQRVLEHPQYQGVMCFTATEAVWLSQQGLDNLLVAYPTTAPQHLAAVAQAIAEGKTIYLMTDQIAHLERIDVVGRQAGVQMPICMDLDLSTRLPGFHFGVFRSSLVDVPSIMAYLHALSNYPNVQLRALMGYEAQIAGLGDLIEGKILQNKVVHWLQRRSRREVAAKRTEAVRLVQERVGTLDFVNGGGTGSLESTAAEAAVTEVTAGSGLYAPALFDAYRHFQHLPAAGFAVEVVRQPQADIYTCLGGGYVASGPIGNDRAPKPYLPEGCQLLPLEGAGEVQTPIRYKGNQTLAVGDPIFMRHAKAGELCERFETLQVIQGGQLNEPLLTYRGMGQCFL